MSTNGPKDIHLLASSAIFCFTSSRPTFVRVPCSLSITHISVYEQKAGQYEGKLAFSATADGLVRASPARPTAVRAYTPLIRGRPQMEIIDLCIYGRLRICGEVVLLRLTYSATSVLKPLGVLFSKPALVSWGGGPGN